MEIFGSLISEFLSSPWYIQVFLVFSIMFPFIALAVFFYRDKKLFDAVDKYGESVLKNQKNIVNRLWFRRKFR
jgi:hypothetical protein